MKKASLWIAFTLVALTAVVPFNADAHSGRTDANGCHTNRKTGEYHCHGGGSSSSSNSSSPSNPYYGSPSTTSPSNNQCLGMPQVDPWRLPKPVLMGNAKASYYYKGVVLAGDTEKVQAFLSCYDLTTKGRPDYTSYRPIWAACQEIMGPGGPRGSQTVCVALDEKSRAADDRIYSKEYASKVADKVFAWF
jgi:hypothetical protein